MKRYGALTNHVRVLNGQEGEWVAQLVNVDEATSFVSQSRRSRRRRRRHHDDNHHFSVLAEYMERLAPQPKQRPYRITLWIPSLKKKKERKKWLLEKVIGTT